VKSGSLSEAQYRLYAGYAKNIFALIAKLECYEIMICLHLGPLLGLPPFPINRDFLAASGEFLAGVIIAGSNFSEQISVIMFV
jgi:hypothetical protein